MSGVYGPVDYEKLRDKVRRAIDEASVLQPINNIDVPLSDLKNRLPRFIVDSAGNELSNYIKNLDIALSALRDALTARLPPFSTGGTGQVTVGTTATQITSFSTPTKHVLLKADMGNSGNIYVGFSSSVSSTTGFKLAPGENLSIPINDLSKIWLIADADGQVLYYIYLA